MNVLWMLLEEMFIHNCERNFLAGNGLSNAQIDLSDFFKKANLKRVHML